MTSVYAYALVAQEAYDAPPDIGKADSASRAIVRKTPGGLIVAFPGSNNLPSWLADFNARQLDVPGIGTVHRGFWEAWSAMAVDVLAAINGVPVTLVGHSLGAALALMAAAAMTVGGNPPSAVYGFEPPRVSPTSCVADLLAGVPVWLCRNGSDPVPDVPPLWRHGGKLQQIGRAPTFVPDLEDHRLPRVAAVLAASVATA